MLGKCLWVSAALVMLAVADPDSGAGSAVRTAEPGNWTVDNCIVLKMSAQVRDNRESPVFRIRIRIGSRFNQVGGGKARAKMTHKSRENLRNFMV
jgi:hypothetical protein